mmetsp:Transcript_41344/g.80964  ORF Transcript_41344/g.80964 Transcript_41344/m.80964 type:complete len:259 (-) Transcript_41344:558-1334(-)
MPRRDRLAFISACASSTNSTPPRASSSTFAVACVVRLASRLTRSMRSTSTKDFFRTAPRSYNARLSMRATALFPEPGFPTKTICGARTGAAPSPASPASSMDRRRPRTCALTACRPTIFESSASKRSTPSGMETGPDPSVPAARSDAVAMTSSAFSSVAGSTPTECKAEGNRSRILSTAPTARRRSARCLSCAAASAASFPSSSSARAECWSAFCRRVSSGGGGIPPSSAETTSPAPSARARSAGVMPSSLRSSSAPG